MQDMIRPSFKEQQKRGQGIAADDGRRLPLGVTYSDSVVGVCGVTGVGGERGESPPVWEVREAEGGRECWNDHRRGNISPRVDVVLDSA